MKQRLPALGLLALASACHGQVTKVHGGFLLRVHYQKGMVIRNTMTNSIIGLGGSGSEPMKLPIPLTIRVLDVKGRTARLLFEMGSVPLGGSQQYPGAKATIMLNDRNEPAEAGGSLPGAARLPLKAVKPGDTWTAVAPISAGASGTIEVKSTYRFVGVRLTGGPPVAVIKYTIGGTAQGSGTETLLVKDGTVYSNVTDLKLGAIRVHSVLKRI